MVIKLLKNSVDVVFFRVGAIGYLLGFLAWLFWLLLVILSYVVHQFAVMSGVFFLSVYYETVFHFLISVSWTLSSFGCFGLKRKYGADSALFCGISQIIVAIVLIYSNLSYYLLANYFPLWFYVPIALFLGMLILGGTLLINRKFFQSALLDSYKELSILASVLFVAAGLIGILFYPVILYWGIELWLLFAGWLYAAGALLTAQFLFRASEA